MRRTVMTREAFIKFLKRTELYKNAKEDLDKLITYMSVRPEPGSLAYFFGFKEIQAGYQEELEALTRGESVDFKKNGMSMEEAVYFVSLVRMKYEAHLELLRQVIESGVEDFLLKTMDMVDEYYVLQEDRDKSLDPYIEKKPESLEEMERLAFSDAGFRSIQSAWKEAYGDHFGMYFLREQVGFDRTKFNVVIKSMDVKKLMKAKKKHQSQTYNELPRIIVEKIDPEDETDLPVNLPIEENDFKKIEVTLSHHISFLFERNNSPLTDEGRRKSDIYLLKVTVEPEKGYEILGNIRNYSYDEMVQVVRNAITELYELTGIEIDKDSVQLNDVELNLTFRQWCDFNELMRSVSYYQNYLRKGYVTKEFKAADEGIVHFCADMSDCETEDQYTKKKHRIEHIYSKMRTTGFTSFTQSVAVKLYDKKEETIAYAASQGYDLKIEGPEAITRLEFKIRNRDQLKRYFDTGKEPVFLKNLSQEKIEKAYVNLVNIFFKKTYEKGYVPESTEALIGIISTLDTSQKGGKWKQELINAILSQEIWQKSTPALLTEKDITSVIQYNKTFARHPKTYQKKLWELLKESPIYKKGQTKAYDMLFNFLNKTYNLKTLARKRRIGYAVSDPGEELPDMEEDIEEILKERSRQETLRNLDLDDYYDLEAVYPKGVI